MSTEETTFLDGMAAELTGGAALPEQIDHDNALPEALAAEVEQYDAYAADRDAHLVQNDEGPGDQVPANQQGRKQVPLTALQEERQRRQQRDAELAQERANNLALRQQFDHALAQQQAQFLAAQQQAQQVQVPDFADDPEGHVRALAQQFEQRLADIQGQQQAAVNQHHVQQQIAHAGQQVAQVEAQFMEQVGADSYKQAHAVVEQDIMQNLQRMYPMASAAELQQAQLGAAFGFLQQCEANGVNPAEHIWQRAQQLGFKPGHRVPTMRPSAPTSLSSLPGANTTEDDGKLTAAKVNSMSDAEFAALVADMKRASHSGPRA